MSEPAFALFAVYGVSCRNLPGLAADTPESIEVTQTYHEIHCLNAVIRVGHLADHEAGCPGIGRVEDIIG